MAVLPVGCLKLMVEAVGRLFSPIPEMLSRDQREAVNYLIDVIEDEETTELLKSVVEVDPYVLPDECALDVCTLTPAKYFDGLVQGPCRILQEARLIVDRELCSEPVTASVINQYLKKDKNVELRAYALPLHNGRIVPGIPSYCSFEVKSVLIEKEGIWEGSWVSSSLNNNWYRLPDSMKVSDSKAPAAKPIKHNIEGLLGAGFPAWTRGADPVPSGTKVDFKNITPDNCKTENINIEILQGILQLLLRASKRFSGSPNLEGVPAINKSPIKLLLPTSVLAAACPWWLTPSDLKLMRSPEGESIALCYIAYNKKGEIFDITEKGSASKGGWLSGVVIAPKHLDRLSLKRCIEGYEVQANGLEERYFCFKIAKRAIMADGTARVSDGSRRVVVIRPVMPSTYPFIISEDGGCDLPSTPTHRARVGRVSFGTSLDIEGSTPTIKKPRHEESPERDSQTSPPSLMPDILSRMEAAVLECSHITNHEKRLLISELPGGKLRSCCPTLHYQCLEEESMPYFKWMVVQEWLYGRGGLVIGHDLDLCMCLLDIQASSCAQGNTLVVVSCTAEIDVWVSSIDCAYRKKRVVVITSLVDLCGVTPGELESCDVCIMHRDVLSSTARLSLLCPDIVTATSSADDSSQSSFESVYKGVIDARLASDSDLRSHELELVNWQRVIVADLTVLTKKQQLVVQALKSPIKWVFSSKNLAFVSVIPSGNMMDLLPKSPTSGTRTRNGSSSVNHRKRYEECLAFSTHHMLYIGGLDISG
eukprot:TRINITY_DN31638_c0_g1_i1.p1 TRINITY_DN31638_c0_g1~~TRINITY_DN31638_c0_g1_i1.p1  ORF type:complete len:774 (+),score=134.20 TRINITY_DN31638_c0_g1_i1:37-2322(+)